MSKMIINHGNASARAGEIRSSGSGIVASSLSPTDDQTTLTANSRSKEVFEMAQASLTSFSNAVNQAGGAVVSISASFDAVDRL